MDDEPFATLPALKGLAKLGDIRPTVAVDSREQLPLVFRRLPAVVTGLQSADYSYLGGQHLFGIERKGLEDLVACCGVERDRFFRECHRLRGFDFARLLIISTRETIEAAHYRSAISPKAVLATLSAIEVRFRLPVVFEPDADRAARLVERWVYFHARECVENANTLLRGNTVQVEVAAPA